MSGDIGVGGGGVVFGIGSRGEKIKDVLGYGSVARGEIIVLAFNANTLQTHL